MERSKTKRLPRFRSLDTLVEFFDTHDLGDYELREAQFDVDINKRVHLVAIDQALADKVAAIARARHTSPRRLIHSWLKEKTQHQA